MNPTLLEISANVLNLICVYLIYKNKSYNWIFGIANALLFITVFLPAKLYGDTALQVMYAGLSCYGLYQWLFGNGGIKVNLEGQNTELQIEKFSKKCLIISGFATVLLSFVFYWVLKTYTNTDVAQFDGILTAMSVVATLMMAFKGFQHWYLWIATNVFYVPLYIHKGLYITAFCQLPLAIFSIIGLRYWIYEYEKSTSVG
jgi:nicotinamide mononucleotide transporter